MTKLTTTNVATMKKAIGAALLVLLMQGQVAFAQEINLGTATSGVSTSGVSTKSALFLPLEIVTQPVEDSVEPETDTAPENELTVQEVLLSVCKANGYGQECAKTLLGIMWNESSNRFNVIGDNGKARGYFQIHYKLHKITTACAEDLVCSANWTLNYLEGNSYPKYVNYAIQCHNSCNVNNGYAAKAVRNGKNLWNRPLAVKQAAPIELAVK